MRKVELICVSPDNNNKYYIMEEDSSGTFTAKWGRVGYAEQTQTYSIGLWNSKYKEKLKRGYKDISDLKTKVIATTFKDVLDVKVQGLLNDLQSYSKNKIIENYSVGTTAVTLAQVEAAQTIIDTLAKNGKDVAAVDKYLMELYTTIPRHMKDVRKQLYKNNQDNKWLTQKVATEQNLLDVMRQQVELNKVDNKGDQTLLEALGVNIADVDNFIITDIRKLLGDESNKFSRAWAFENYATEIKLKEQIKKSHSDKIIALWHGSRNENWLNIVKTGLLIRPAGVMTTGSMFGNGIYFADKATKSLGYTSMNGSYWARGNDNRCYLALYAVNVGNQFEVYDGQYGMDYNRLKLLNGNYDSVFAKAGRSLYNNEYIIYHPNQCSIKFLVELKNK